MKILVLEDDFQVLKGAFDYLNLRFYSGGLEVENYAKTQDFKKLSSINDFEKIFVDISLHRNSEQDGYSFILSIKQYLKDLDKVVVITGSDKVAQKLSEIGIENVKILSKPITYLDLKSVIPAHKIV